MFWPALVEAWFSCFKRILGSSLRSHSEIMQVAEIGTK